MTTTLVRFLVPGTSSRFRCGGLSVEQQTARLVKGLCPTELVTYRERSADHPYLDDLLSRESPQNQVLWIVSWGFDVPHLIRRLRGHRVAYHAHSSGYGFSLPQGVPVLAVSRNTLGYWGNRAPRNPLLLLPNALEPVWLERLPLAKQIDLFHTAECVVGPHGAGLTNLMFCRPGAVAVEISTPLRVLPCFSEIAHHRRLQHHLELATPVNRRHFNPVEGVGDSDLLVDPAAIRGRVEQLLAVRAARRLAA